MKYYVLTIESGVDAETLGPFQTAAQRDDAARDFVRSGSFRADYDPLFRMDIEGDNPQLSPFSSSEIDDGFLGVSG